MDASLQEHAVYRVEELEATGSERNRLCDWHGVTTDGNGEVTGLNLRNNNVRGSISSSIAVLAKLGTLNLSCNTSLSGELPLQLKDIDHIDDREHMLNGL